MKNRITILLLAFIFCIYIPLTVSGQTKFEREYRIKEQDVPQKALTFMDSLSLRGKIKWFAEESQDGKTIEAKTVYNKDKYSIEFDSIGNVLDVEKKVSFKNLKPDLIKNICQQLSRNLSKHKIIKTQIQWMGNTNVLSELIKEGKSSEDYTENYEMVVKGKKDGQSSYYEFLLDSKGQVVKVLEIIQRGSDNLVF